MRSVKLIGVSGKKGSGKDLLTSTLQDIFPEMGYKNKKYADILKSVVQLLIGCSKEDLESQEFKEADLGIEWGEKNRMTARMMLQRLGTDVFRENIHENIWINALFSGYSCDNWIISDVRFENEAEAIRKRGGMLIRIERDAEGDDMHQSENELDGYNGFDYVIHNNGSKEDFVEKIKGLFLDIPN